MMVCNGQGSRDALHSNFESNQIGFVMIRVVSSTRFIFLKQLLRYSIQDRMVF